MNRKMAKGDQYKAARAIGSRRRRCGRFVHVAQARRLAATPLPAGVTVDFVDPGRQRSGVQAVACSTGLLATVEEHLHGNWARWRLRPAVGEAQNSSGRLTRPSWSIDQQGRRESARCPQFYLPLAGPYCWASGYMESLNIRISVCIASVPRLASGGGPTSSPGAPEVALSELAAELAGDLS